MKIPEGWLGESAQDRMADRAAGAYAPVALWACMSSLTGGAEPIATTVQRDIHDGSTEWRALWLKGNALAFGSVVKGKEGWSAYSDAPGDDEPDVTTGWVRSIKQVSRVELSQAECRRISRLSESGRAWTWSSSARVVFRDGGSVDLPLFGKPQSDVQDAEIQTLLTELSQRL
jgi:hypothetical protein